MKLLVLGGTNFVGRHIVSELLAAGHIVSLFHRGKSNPDLFPEAEHLIGDRDSDLSEAQRAVHEATAAGRSFDACVDVSGYTLRQIERSLDAVADRIGRYLFISTVSVYTVPVPPDFKEDHPIEEIDDPYVSLSPETYGSLKAACERAVTARFGERALIFRPGLVNGPWDPTDRATYWSIRARQGGEIFVPAAPDDPFQVVDARDVGQGVIHSLEQELSGTYTMVNEPTTWQAWLETSRNSGGRATADGHASASYLFADDQKWVEAQLEQLSGSRPGGPLPMYLPRRHGWNFWRASNLKAREAGISFRPYRETIADTLSWRFGEGTELQAGLTPQQERQLIEAWRTSR